MKMPKVNATQVDNPRAEPIDAPATAK